MKRPIYNDSWSDDVKVIYRHDLQEIWDSSIAPHIWNQYHNQLDLYMDIAKSSKPLDILDVGCAQGTLAIKLAEAGHRVIAVDFRQEFLDYAQSRYTHGDIQFIQANALDLALDRQFDLIFANQIVEHLVYPHMFISGLKDCLNAGGHLVMTTPNGDYFMNNLQCYSELGDPKKWEHMQFTADGDGHFFAYLDRELVDVFIESGIADVKATYFESPWISGHMKIRYLHNKLPVFILKKLDSIVVKIPYLNRKISHQLLIVGKI